MKFKNYLLEYDTRKSIFDSSVTVVILYKDDPEYLIWKKQFKKYGLAIGVPAKKMIMWDGEEIKKLSKDEILFIEAHEYSHFVLGKHASEIECDELAIENLMKIGKKKAAEIGIKNFYKRHNRKYDNEV
jgi:hypothetical protein